MTAPTKSLENAVTQVEQEIENVEARERELRAALKVLRELMNPSGNDKASASPTASRSLRSKEMTIAEAAEIVLRDNGRPMKSRPIAEQMMDRGFRYKKPITKLRESVNGVLYREAKNGETFFRRDGGVFGLLEWQDS